MRASLVYFALCLPCLVKILISLNLSTALAVARTVFDGHYVRPVVGLIARVRWVYRYLVR